MDHSQELPFEWDNDIDGFPADKFDRAKYAKFLTNYLIGKSKEENYVLNLNASWGAGKTWFLKRWFDTIKNNHPAIYIDCWKNDHSKDPFLAVMSAIANGLDELVDKKYKKETLSSKGVLLIKSVAPEIAKGLIKKCLGLDTDAVTKILNDDDSSSISEVGGQLVSELIKLHEKANDTLDEFKLTVSSYLDVIELESPRNLPLFVFLDELDRCRPTYAIETLETVKHIFDMKNVVFIIATDKEQLQHSIRAVYGNDFNSSKYLDRFFNRTVTLQQKSNEDFIAHKLTTACKLDAFISSGSSNLWLYGDGEKKRDMCIDILIKISHVFDMDLRTISQWLDRLDASFSNRTEEINFVYLSFLLAANCHDQLVYDNLVARRYENDGVNNIVKTIYKDRVVTSHNVTLSVNCNEIGESIVYGNKGVANPWLGSETVKFDIVDIFKMCEQSLSSIVRNELPEKICDRIHRIRQTSQVVNFESTAFIYLLIKSDKKRLVNRDDYIQLVELATILE